MPAETKKQKPVQEIRIGSVRLAIWEREGGKNGKFYTAGKPELSYKDDDGKWHNDAGSYSRIDLLNLAKVALEADSAILKLNRAAKAEDTGGEPGE